MSAERIDIFGYSGENDQHINMDRFFAFQEAIGYNYFVEIYPVLYVLWGDW